MDDRRRDGGTNSTLRIKEHGTHLTLNEHDDDDDDDISFMGARGDAVGLVTALQAGRSRVRYSIVPLECFIDVIIPTLESTQPS